MVDARIRFTSRVASPEDEACRPAALGEANGRCARALQARGELIPRGLQGIFPHFGVNTIASAVAASTAVRL